MRCQVGSWFACIDIAKKKRKISSDDLKPRVIQINIKFDVARHDKVPSYHSHCNKARTGIQSWTELLDDWLQLARARDPNTKISTSSLIKSATSQLP